MTDSIAAAVLGLIQALLFSIKSVLVRKSVLKVNPLKVSFAYTITGLFAFLVFGIVNGDISYSYRLNQTAILFLALAGILHFIIGRTFDSYSMKLIGVSRTQVLTHTQMIYSPILAIFFLGEFVSVGFVAGLGLVVLGTYLILLSMVHSRTNGRWIKQPKHAIRGVTFGLLCGAFWGITPILVKVGVTELGSPVLSNIISYLFASVCYPVLLFGGDQHRGFRNLDRTSWVFILAAGILVCMAQALRYTALLIAPVSFVAPFASSSPLITLLLSYLLMRETEVINLRAIAGILLSLLGYLVMLW